MNNSFDNLANQDSSISDNSGLLNNDDFSSTPDDINQELNQNLTDSFHQQQQFDYQNSGIGLGENQDLAQNDFSFDNLANQDSGISDNSRLLNNDYFSSTPDEINQDFGTDFSGGNSEFPLPEISNFQHEQNNLSLSSQTLENQNIGLSSHQIEYQPTLSNQSVLNSEVLHYSDNEYPYTTIDNAGNVYLHTKNDINGHYAGYLKGREVYNSGHYYLGYAGTDSKIYDNHNHAVGWVDNNGNIYNNGGIKVHHTNKGVVGAAAYLLCSYYGGAN
ncbi:hypothetical protein [Dapis sp. BLCC M229]|uniref:hypothetical protein n=1 Tax=Dapis sp. BLCC M229 TaxID=3400188 RepID=UPI003CE8F042